jgi:G3E family GTPase
MMASQASKLPVTIVTGFLGAGKTSLISRLIKECKGRRIAVIQNEVSEEMGIESAVLTDSSGKIIPDFFELPNGCVCCSAKDDMILALENIVNLGRERIDAIVVETTGIADPCSVVGLFWVDKEICSSIELDGVVAVVDAVNFPSIISSGHILEHADIGRRQVAVADRVIVNKLDLVDSTVAATVRDLVKSLNPSAEIIETSKSEVDADWVLNIGSFSSKRAIDSMDHSLHEPSTVDHVFLTFPFQNFDPQQLERAIGEIVWEESVQAGVGNVYRVKGIFRSSKDNKWHMVQGVGMLFETTPIPEAESLPSNVNGDAKFLFIGSGLNRDGLFSRLSHL